MIPHFNSDHNFQTIFLDRDGVLNHQKEGSYIFTWDEFVFYEGVLEAMYFFATKFQYIFIVTNQRGVGKGLMTESDLQQIHTKMKKSIELAGGRIDGIYYCTELESINRKPNPGMAMQAQHDFSGIDFSRSIMVGNSMSDMEFGRNIGATTVFLTTTNPSVNKEDKNIDTVYTSLADFASALQSLR